MGSHLAPSPLHSRLASTRSAICMLGNLRVGAPWPRLPGMPFRYDFVLQRDAFLFRLLLAQSILPLARTRGPEQAAPSLDHSFSSGRIALECVGRPAPIAIQQDSGGLAPNVRLIACLRCDKRAQLLRQQPFDTKRVHRGHYEDPLFKLTGGPFLPVKAFLV